MLPDDSQVSSRPSLHIGMMGFQEIDLPLSCQHVLASQGSIIQISWIPNSLNSTFDVDNPYDFIFLDCRIDQGKTGILPEFKKIFPDVLILGFIDEDGSDVVGKSDNAVDWLVNENLAAIAMHWAIQEGVKRKRLINERNQLRQQVEDIIYNKEMADVASTVLHNVGNVLNSINVAVNVVHELVNQSSIILVHRIAELLKGHNEDWEVFLTQDPKGKKIPPALVKLGSHLVEEQKTVLKEIQGLLRNIDHVKQIILSHQALAKSQDLSESFSLGELLDQAVELSFQPGDVKWITIQRDYQHMQPVVIV